jgi:hypothetical protein
MRTCLLHARYTALRRLGLVLGVSALLAACAQPSSTAVNPARSTVATAPASAAPEVTAGCPKPGVLITAERGDAAMGYREMTLRLNNCGDKAYPLRGRPDIIVLDKDRNPLDVAVLPSAHYSAEPRQVTLKPGIGAIAVLSWRNTVTDSTVPATTGGFLSVAPVQGAPRQTVTLLSPLDLGNTGRLEASAWL